MVDDCTAALINLDIEGEWLALCFGRFDSKKKAPVGSRVILNVVEKKSLSPPETGKWECPVRSPGTALSELSRLSETV
jgi:hypothetical protein